MQDSILQYFIFISPYYNGFNIFLKKNISLNHSGIIFFCLKSLAVYKLYYIEEENISKESKIFYHIDIDSENFVFIKNIINQYYNALPLSNTKCILKRIRKKDFFYIFYAFQRKKENEKILSLINYREKDIALFSYGKNQISFVDRKLPIYNSKSVDTFYKYFHGMILYHKSNYYSKLISIIKKHKKYLLNIINTITYGDITIWITTSFHKILFLYYLVYIYQNNVLGKKTNQKNRRNIFVLQKNKDIIDTSQFRYTNSPLKLQLNKSKILIIYNYDNDIKANKPSCLKNRYLNNYHFTFLKGYFTKKRFLHQINYKQIKEQFDIVFYYGHSIVENGHIYWRFQDENFLLNPNSFIYYVHLSCINFPHSSHSFDYLPCKQGIFPVSFIENFSPDVFIDNFMQKLQNEKNFMDAWFSLYCQSNREIHEKLFLRMFHFWSC